MSHCHLWLSAIAAALVWGGGAHAVERCVPGEFATIQTAIDAANNGDVVLVAAGTYTESLNFGAKKLVLRSIEGPQATIIDATGNNSSVITMNGGQFGSTRIEGFTITGGTGTTGVGNRSGGRGSSTIGGAFLIENGAPIITHCIIHGNSATDGGAVFSRQASPKFYNCLMYRNVAEDRGGAVYVTGNSPVFIVCTIANNVASTAGAIYLSSFAAPLVDSCIIWSNGASPVVEGTGNANVFFQHSNVELNGNQIPPGGGNRNQDPLFLNAATDRYELTEQSVCIDGGNSPSVAPIVAKDIIGNPRGVNVETQPDAGIPLFDVVVDMGAFEFPVVCAQIDCAGDVNADGVVNVTDLLEVINNWGAICD